MTETARPSDDGKQQQAISVVAGNPTPEELAAVIAVLSAVDDQGVPASVVPQRESEWQRSRRSLRSWSHEARWG